MKYKTILITILCLCMTMAFAACTIEPNPESGSITPPTTTEEVYTYYIMVAKQDIPRGTCISTENKDEYFEIGSMQHTEQYEDMYLSAYEAQEKLATLIGQYVQYDITKGCSISLQYFAPNDPLMPDITNPLIKPMVIQHLPQRESFVSNFTSESASVVQVGEQRCVWVGQQLYPMTTDAHHLVDKWVYTIDGQYWDVSDVTLHGSIQGEKVWTIDPITDTVIHVRRGDDETLQVWTLENSNLQVLTYASTGILTRTQRIQILHEIDMYAQFTSVLFVDDTAFACTVNGKYFAIDMNNIPDATYIVLPENRLYIPNTLDAGYANALYYTDLKGNALYFEETRNNALTEVAITLPEWYRVEHIQYVAFERGVNYSFGKLAIVFTDGTVVIGTPSAATGVYQFTKNQELTKILCDSTWYHDTEHFLIQREDGYFYTVQFFQE